MGWPHYDESHRGRFDTLVKKTLLVRRRQRRSAPPPLVDTGLTCRAATIVSLVQNGNRLRLNIRSDHQGYDSIVSRVWPDTDRR